MYIFFSLGLGILEQQPRTVPTTPGRLLFGSELFRTTKPVTNLNEAKKKSTQYGETLKFHTNQYFGSVEAVSLAVLAFTRKKNEEEVSQLVRVGSFHRTRRSAKRSTPARHVTGNLLEVVEA